MKRRRVKITGIGPVTPAGIGKEEFWKGILGGTSFVRVFPNVGDEYGPFVAAFMDRINVGIYVDKSALPKRIARHSTLAVVAASLAMRDAGISAADLCAARAAVVTGSAIMDFEGILESIDGVKMKGARAALPRILSQIGIGSAANAVSSALGFPARTIGVSNQCISGLDAIAHGANLIASGEIDIAICGGTEAPLNRFPLVELRAAGLTPSSHELPERLSRPFDLWRTTGVVSEGACLVILEPETSPRRGYGYVQGYGNAVDDNDEVCSGMATAGRLALAAAGMCVRDIEVLSAWGPGHKVIDRAEAHAMCTLFGSNIDEIFAGSIKGAIGMPLAAAPAIQVAAALLGFRDGAVPPTVNWQHPDPECALQLSNRVCHLAHDVTLVNAHGFGATNSSIILSRT